LDQAAREEADLAASGGEGHSAVESHGASGPSPRSARKIQERAKQMKPKLVAHSTAMESIQAQTEPIDEEEHLPPGGIPARNHKGERVLLYLGIIDILQSYRLQKRMEHTFKAIIHDGDTVSVHRPGFYAKRFLNFMADVVFKKIPSPLKHSPSRKGPGGGGAGGRLREISFKRIAAQRGASISNEGGSGGGERKTTLEAPSTSGAGSMPDSSFTGSSATEGDFYHRTGLKPDVVPGDYDYSAAAAAAAIASAAATEGHSYQVRGPSPAAGLMSQDLRAPSPSTAAAAAVGAASGCSPSMSRMAKPTHRQHMTIKQQSIDRQHSK